MATLRKLKRQVAKADMEKAGIVQPNKTIFDHMDYDGKPMKVRRPSFFSQHWRDKSKH